MDTMNASSCKILINFLVVQNLGSNFALDEIPRWVAAIFNDDLLRVPIIRTVSVI